MGRRHQNIHKAVHSGESGRRFLPSCALPDSSEFPGHEALGAAPYLSMLAVPEAGRWWICYPIIAHFPDHVDLFTRIALKTSTPEGAQSQ